eukprot:COSAG05_NODE_5160_length_1249_cov_1.021739_1_plen_162_part_00
MRAWPIISARTVPYRIIALCRHLASLSACPFWQFLAVAAQRQKSSDLLSPAENEADVHEWTAAFEKAQRHFQTRGVAAAATTTPATADGAGAVVASATTAAEGSLKPEEALGTAQSGADGEPQPQPQHPPPEGVPPAKHSANVATTGTFSTYTAVLWMPRS